MKITLQSIQKTNPKASNLSLSECNPDELLSLI